MHKIRDRIGLARANASICDMQTLVGIAVLLLSCQSHIAVAHRLDSKAKAEREAGIPHSCEYAPTVLIQHSSLPASRRDGVTATLEAQDDAQATFGLFSEANRIIALGWVRIDWTTNQLLDMTDDIEAPNRLTFRPEDWARVASCLRKLPITP